MRASGDNYQAVSVVVPAYRSPGTLPRLVEELTIHVAPLVDDIELILVDDGSGDGTWAEIESLAETHPWVRGLTMLRNYGQHNALLAGLREARYPVVITMDDDLQNPPDQVPLLLQRLGDDVDLVYGTPTEEPQGLLRNLASRLTKVSMAATLGRDVYPKSSAFRVFRRQLLAAADELHDPYISIDVLLSWATTRVTHVPVRFDVRQAGRSGYSPVKLARHAINMITGYSARPLRWMSVIGLVCALFGFVALGFVLVRYLLGDVDVAGFTFLAAAVTLFSGVQLMSLGLLGEYVARIHFRSMGKPPYVVRAHTVAAAPAEDPDRRRQSS